MKKNWTLLLIFMLTISFTMAQEQQLKTYHFCHPGGREYPADKLSWTGYEDELGNITRHGLYTNKTSHSVNYSLNFVHGKLDGFGKIITPAVTITPHGLTINLKYDNGKLVSINSYYIDSKTQKKIENFKYTLNDEGFLVGDFLFRDDDLNGLKLLQGQFDELGRATGWWSINLDGVKSKVYFEQGYCLGGDEKTIEISRSYLIDKKISEKDLHDKGYYVLVSAMPVREQSLRMAIRMLKTVIVTFDSTSLNNDICMSLHLGDAFNIDSKNIFKIFSLGQTAPLTFMSTELYQNIVSQIRSNTLQVPLQYDIRINKYYILKADGYSRLYIPIDFESDFKLVVGDNHEECGEITDYDGNKYKTIQIGSQCWMKENLRTTHYSDGTEIILAGLIWGKEDEYDADYDKYYLYIPNNDAQNISTYGYLYNWASVMKGAHSSNSTPSRVQGICPTGWHVPSIAEWKQLTDYINNKNEYSCGNSQNNNARAMAIGDWAEWNQPCAPGCNKQIRNATGFSGTPAGIFTLTTSNYGNRFQLINFGYVTGFWSSTANANNNRQYSEFNPAPKKNPIFCNYLKYDVFDMFKYDTDPCYALSVRCIKD